MPTTDPELPKLLGKTHRSLNSPRVLVRLDHVARVVVNANHGTMLAADKLRVTDCIRDCVWLAIPQPTEWQHIGN
jgi:hypothetical protein